MENEINYINDNKKVYELITKSPGKVLLCGGYLIINPKYQGLVITTKTYFESRGRLEILDTIEVNENIQTTIIIQINSKNYNLSFYYKVEISFNENEKEDLNLSINFERLNENDYEANLGRNFKYKESSKMDNENSRDVFIINSLKSAFYYLLLHQICTTNHKEFKGKLRDRTMFIEIDLDADYRFYGYQKNLERDNISKNIKTGLGSSSALVSSLTSNIILNFLQYFDNIVIKSSLNEYDDKIKLCLLLAANNANNQAQNKIGSGFDIYSCLLGSHVFKRRLFDQKLNENFNQSKLLIDREKINLYSKMVMGFIGESYLDKIPRLPKSFFEIKKHFAIISIEIGTDTRSFVKKIMEYANKNKKNEIFDDELFQELNEENEELIQYILNEETDLAKLKAINKNIRSKIRHLSSVAETEIEPMISTEIIDKVLDKGISFGICPGAGGYDGIFVFGFENDTYEKLQDITNSLNYKYQGKININYFPVEITNDGLLIN